MSESKHQAQKNSSRLALQENQDRIVQELEDAFSLGNLNESELERRISAALHARNQDELALLLKDVESKAQTHKDSLSTTVILSNSIHGGRIILPANYNVIAAMGCCTLDLRFVTFSSSHTRIKLKAILGCIDVIVPSGVKLNIHQNPFLAAISCKVPNEELAPMAPTLHIEALAAFGAIDFRTS